MSVISTFVTYTAFGLKIKSMISLPELTQINLVDTAEIEIVVADLDTEFAYKVSHYGKIIVEDHKVMFLVKDAAKFLIQDGQKITVSLMANYDINKVRLYILGTCMGILLMQRKILALHGSAVAINGIAYAFVGNSGAGKSTLATAFMKNGYKMLSDDVIPVMLNKNDDPYIIPTYPQQKLWDESLEYFEMSTRNYNPLFDRENKFAIPVHSQYYKDPLPLGGIFEITKTDGGSILIRPIQHLERFRTLFNQTFRNSLIPRLGLMEWHFKESAKIIKNIRMYQIKRPSSVFTATELVGEILNTITEEIN